MKWKWWTTSWPTPPWVRQRKGWRKAVAWCSLCMEDNWCWICQWDACSTSWAGTLNVWFLTALDEHTVVKGLEDGEGKGNDRGGLLNDPTGGDREEREWKGVKGKEQVLYLEPRVVQLKPSHSLRY